MLTSIHAIYRLLVIYNIQSRSQKFEPLKRHVTSKVKRNESNASSIHTPSSCTIDLNLDLKNLQKVKLNF